MLLDRRGRTFKDISAILKGELRKQAVSLALLKSFAFAELREVIASGVDFSEEEGTESKVDPDDPAVQKVMILDALTQFLDGI